MMEERYIKISFEKAKEWYNSNNSSLKEIALQAFTKEELEIIDLKELIKSLLSYIYFTDTQRVQLESLINRKDITKISAPKLLRILSVYFNEIVWKKKEGEEGFFFYKKEGGFMHSSPKIMDKYWCISSHTSVCYPTLVYFKREKDCKEAYNVMKRLGKLESLYTDF